MQPASLADPMYYLRNAEALVAWCLSHYADLLSPVERQRLHDWQQLGEPAKALLIRLVMRKGELFRSDKLVYEEIGPITELLDQLAGQHLIDCQPHLCHADLGRLLKRNELMQLLQATSHKPDKGQKKAELMALVEKTDRQEGAVTAWWPACSLTIVRLMCNGLFDLVRLLFFGNLHQQWSEFVVTELGLQRYEQVAISATMRAFQSREEIDFYLLIHGLRERLEAGEAPADLAEELPLSAPSAWLQKPLQSLQFVLGHAAERQGDVELALTLYQRSASNEAKIRELRVMEKVRPVDATWNLACNYLETIQQPAVRILVERVAKRCAKKLDRAFAPQTLIVPKEYKLPLKRLDTNVEDIVCQHLISQVRKAFHLENDLFVGLFGLLFWPAIYAPVAGAFFNPFQMSPRELYSADFSIARREFIEQAFGYLGDGSYKQRMLSTWQQKQGISNRFVNWQKLNHEVLALALDTVPATHLDVIFRYMLLDLRHHCSGMPDLVVFDPQSQGYELIEVKGPGDRLQEHQRIWLDFFAKNSIPARVCYVNWLD